MKKMKSNNTTNTAYIVFKHNTSDYYVVDKEIYENTFDARGEYVIVFEVEYTDPKMKFGFTPVKNKPYNQNVQPILDEVGIK